MASCKIYNPRTGAFELLNINAGTQLPMNELLLLNILIELQTQTLMIGEAGKDYVSDSPETIRNSIVSEIQ